MSNFLQHNIWKDIQTKVYQKSSFHHRLFGKNYFGIRKEKQVGPLSLCRLQIMGVHIPEDEYEIRKAIKEIKRTYRRKRDTIMFQRGITNHITTLYTPLDIKEETIATIKRTRTDVQHRLRGLGLRPSIRENMPEANILVDLSLSDEILLDRMSKQARRFIKKAQNKGVHIDTCTREADYDEFYTQWKSVATSKGFNIIPREQYDRLVTYIESRGCGHVFTAKLQNKIVAGGIYVWTEDRLVYLYGFSTREEGLRNIGGHHFLSYWLFDRARQRQLSWFDLFGGAPTGADAHHLAPVSAFKESLGGKKVEYYGNFDIPLHSMLYKVFQLRQKIR